MKITIFAFGMLMAAATFAQAPDTSTAEGWFQSKDTNTDGFLVISEVTGTRTDTNFASYDTNGDGKLSLAEYKVGREATEGR
jgi:hypothetical protein